MIGFVVVCMLACRSHGCTVGDNGPGSPQSGCTDGSVAARPQPIAPVELELLAAESRRDPDSITLEHLSSADPAIRRAATRALARIGADGRDSVLERGLVDEDPEVVAWAAFGLGWRCRSSTSNPADIERALVIRAARADREELSATPSRTGGARVNDGAPGSTYATGVAPTAAIARALGRCATETAERTLASWLELEGDRARAAALALGDLACRRKDLTEATKAALFAAASTRGKIREALYPLARTEHHDLEAQRQLLEIGKSHLLDPGPSRIFAIQALARAGHRAQAELARIVVSTSEFEAAERIAAVHGLAGMGSAGRDALEYALSILVRTADPSFLGTVDSASYGVLHEIIDGLGQPAEVVVGPRGRAPLFALAGLAAPRGTTFSSIPRVARLRCAAASVLANAAPEDPLVVNCDPTPHSEIVELAQLRALDRRAIRGRRLTIWNTLIGSSHPRVREAALAMIGGHPEILVKSTRGSGGGEGVRLNDAIGSARERAWPFDAGEVQGAVANAAGATARPGRAADELTRLVPLGETIGLTVGAVALQIRLDPTTAPFATTRASELFRSGFYDGLAVHRVVPGLLVQFGDRARDGDGGAGTTRTPLWLESAPVDLEPGDVAIASSGPDAGSTQIFVVLSRQPLWDGAYSIIGKAQGDWARVAEGDIMTRTPSAP